MGGGARDGAVGSVFGSPAFAGSDPIVIGEQPAGDVPHVVVSRYR